MQQRRNLASKSVMRLFVVPAGLILAALAAWPAGAQDASRVDAKPQEQVEPFYGSFGTSVPIEVPAFHGIEPGLALSYNSSSGNGFAGVGWGLSGLSTIERASPGKGAPNYGVLPDYPTGIWGEYFYGGTGFNTFDHGRYDSAISFNWGRGTPIRKTRQICFGEDNDGRPKCQTAGHNDNWTARWTGMVKADHSETYTFYTTTDDGARLWVDGNLIVDKWVYQGATEWSGSITLEAETWYPVVMEFFEGGGNAYARLAWSSASTPKQTIPASHFHPFKQGTAITSPEDIFMLDGQEMIACTTAMTSPSCTTGGTHTTKIESYLRIRHDEIGNVWEVWDRGGVKTSYGAVMGPDTSGSSGTYRWAIAGVEDPHGNRVTYDWWCDGGAECYPDRITYNGTTVTFHREMRPDPLKYATGGSVASAAYRLKTIDVQVGTERARSYALDYATSPVTAQSQLTSVQQYGRDAVLDASGVVTGGSALPPSGFGWDAEALGGFSAAHLGQLCRYGNDTRLLGDFNGDGRSDVLCYGRTNGEHMVKLSNGSGGFTHVGGSNWCAQMSQTLGDFNGDGMTDMHCHRKSDGQTWVAFAKGDGTFDYQTKHGWCAGATSLVAGDFNGDGMTDLQCRRSSGSSYLGLSDGDGNLANVAIDWTRWCTGDLLSGDFNGDGITDLYCRNSNGGRLVGLSVGDGSFTLASSGNWCAAPGRLETGEFNGDGKTDVLCSSPSSGATTVGLSKGDGTFESVFWGNWCGYPEGSRALHVADFNGDDRDDLLCRYRANGALYLAHSKGDGSFAGHYWQTWENDRYYKSILPGDFDGDGTADMYIHEFYADKGDTWIGLSTAVPSNRLTSVTTPLGGTTMVEYTASPAWDNTNLPFPVQTVSALTTDDGRGNVATTSYEYAGGRWDSQERRFLGFHTAEATLPCIDGETACPTAKTWFVQDYGAHSKPEKIERRDGAGNLLSEAVEVYSINGDTLPYTSLNTESRRTLHDGAASRTTETTRIFDAYANLVEQTSHDDVALAGDELTTVTDFAPNTADYIVALPARTRTYDGVGTSGTLLTESLTYYDGAVTWNTPPLRGDATMAKAWDDQSGGYVTTQAEYDAVGNVTATVDPLGARSELIYDTTYQRFVVETRDALYSAGDLRHKTTAIWDPVCGKVTRATDINGQTTTDDHDAFCRRVRSDGPLGGFAATSYANLGDPLTQYIETQGPPADSSGNLWSRAYLDGFGRIYKAEAKGPAAGQEIVTETAFNARGAVAGQTLPRYAGDPTYETTTDYDALDRAVDITYPDLNGVDSTYGLGAPFTSSTTTDELGQAATSYRDARGRVVKRETTLDGAPVVTTFSYDPLGRLTGITDDAGNRWSYSYSSLGRKLTASDPDLGDWSYAYDAAGRLTARTDALGQRTEFTYDTLGRRLSKTTRAGTPEAKVTTYKYDQERAGWFNVGRLTRQANDQAIIRPHYDAAGRLAKKHYIVDNKHYYIDTGYDAAGRVLWRDYPRGVVAGTPADPYRYDAAGRLTAIPGIIDSMTYQANGRVTEVVRANGVVTTYGYSQERGWLESLNTVSGAAVIQDLLYTRDIAGQITQVASHAAKETWNYGYDELRRLVSATNTDDATLSRSYAYDSIGNMTENSAVGSYSYPLPGEPRPHAATQAGSKSYGYDANGNMISRAGQTNVFDGENRPVRTGPLSVAYGPDGSRLRKDNGQLEFLTMGEVEILPGQYFITLPGDALNRNGNVYWLHRDHLGSVQAMTNAAGIETQRKGYAPFGKQISKSGKNRTPKNYIGERLDRETGLLYLNARYYDPKLGRFLSADPSSPLRRGVGLNRYAYALNNPVMHRDPSGLYSIDTSPNAIENRYGSASSGAKASRDARGYNDDRDNDDGGKLQDRIDSLYPPSAPSVAGIHGYEALVTITGGPERASECLSKNCVGDWNEWVNFSNETWTKDDLAGVVDPPTAEELGIGDPYIQEELQDIIDKYTDPLADISARNDMFEHLRENPHHVTAMHELVISPDPTDRAIKEGVDAAGESLAERIGRILGRGGLGSK